MKNLSCLRVSHGVGRFFCMNDPFLAGCLLFLHSLLFFSNFSACSYNSLLCKTTAPVHLVAVFEVMLFGFVCCFLSFCCNAGPGFDNVNLSLC